MGVGALIGALGALPSQTMRRVMDWYKPPPPPPPPVKRKQTVLEMLLERGLPETHPRIQRIRAWNATMAARAAESQPPPARWSKIWWAHRRFELKLRIRRAFIVIAEKLVRKVWKVFFDRWFYVKTIYSATTDDEAAVLYFLRDRTSIPVPHIYLHFRYGRHLHIIMDRAPGVPLDRAILTATDEEHEAYIAQLAKIMHELRALKTPFDSRICSVTGAGIRDVRLDPWCAVGPFQDEAAFRRFRVRRLICPIPSPHFLGHDIDHPIVFTHCDLAPRNIMVKDGRITAVIDWEMSGWYPDYWEVIKTRFYANGGRDVDPAGAIFRERYVPHLLPPYPIEVYAEENFLHYAFQRPTD